MKDFNDKLNAFFAKLNNKVRHELPRSVAETAVNHFKEAFTKKSWDGVPWQAYGNKRREPKRGSLMMRSNSLFASIRPTLVSASKVTINAGNRKVPYARVHNEGGVISHKARQSIVTHKAHTRGKYRGKTLFAKNNSKASFSQKAIIPAYSQTMPKRQFMGKSKALLNEIETNFKNSFKTL